MNKNTQDKRAMRVRWGKVIEDLTEISNMQPRECYMYRLMDTVIFHDFETALGGVVEDFKEAQNDNNKELS